MHSLWIFPIVAAALVHLAGRKDAARDPRLTTLALVLLAAAPVLARVLPKAPILPAAASSAAGAASGACLEILPWIWLTGTAIALGRLLLAAAGLMKWRAHSQLLTTTAAGIEVRVLPGLTGPVAAGVFRKSVFVPESSSSWTPETWRMVMAHESGHHARRDPLRRWIAGIAVAMHWFNPLVWWIARRLELQCECACDARVVRTGTDPRTYAALLCEMASGHRASPHAIAMAQPSSLEQRVKRLIQPGGARGLAFPASIAAAITLSGTLASVVGSKTPPTHITSPAPTAYSAREINTRWSASPFPGED